MASPQARRLGASDTAQGRVRTGFINLPLRHSPPRYDGPITYICYTMLYYIYISKKMRRSEYIAEMK
jgi:hypothetical protein